MRAPNGLARQSPVPGRGARREKLVAASAPRAFRCQPRVSTRETASGPETAIAHAAMSTHRGTWMARRARRSGSARPTEQAARARPDSSRSRSGRSSPQADRRVARRIVHVSGVERTSVDRHVDGDVRDEDGVGRPRDPRPLQSPEAKDDRKEQERNQDVLPQVGDRRPERERDISAARTAEERQRLGGQEDREQAERSQRVTRFSRLSSSHDTRTPPPRVFHIQSWTSTTGAAGSR